MAILKIIEANNSLGRPEKRNPEQNREEGQVCCFVKGVKTEVTISKAFKQSATARIPKLLYFLALTAAESQ